MDKSAFVSDSYSDFFFRRLEISNQSKKIGINSGPLKRIETTVAVAIVAMANEIGLGLPL